MLVDQSKIDLLELVSSDTTLKKVANTAGGEWHGSCPFCGGKDRFSVQPHQKPHGRWFCRKCTDRGGDALTYVMRRDNLDFKAALRLLRLESGSQAYRIHRVSTPLPRIDTPPIVNDLKEDYVALNDVAWQQAAADFHQCCRDNLQSGSGQRGIDYLLGRGLTWEIIEKQALGYNPTDCHAQWGAVDVWLPAGIVIPWVLGGKYWNLRIRRLEKNASPKYISPKGIANGLYCEYGHESVPIIIGDIVIMTEGEFDAMVAQVHAQAAFGERVKAVATGSAMGSRVFEWVCRINRADRVLLAFDDDLEGDKAATWWREQLGEGKTFRLRPTRHDVTDMALAGEDFVSWLCSAGLTPIAAKPDPKVTAV
ncbi:MAG TPA: CHC2 zinc finger domain-containing protein, partial [Aggregatilineales bacterium]|nr:CHC2 zinc finger domain-containing protein [Aggregatilineales bacterium]